MKFFKGALLAIGALASVTMSQVQAETTSTCRVVGVIGTDMIVRLSRNVIISEIEIGTVGTSGTDNYFLGSLDVGLFNNQTSGTYFCYVTSEQADTNNNFRLLLNTDPNKFVMLTVTKDTSTGGTLLSQPVAIYDGNILRTYVAGTDPIIEDEVQRITYYATDNSGNSTSSGVYEAYFHYTWVQSS